MAEIHPNRVIWCLGMYASASTWLFNVIRQSSLATQTGEVRTYFASGEMNFLPFDQGEKLNLVKSHEITEEATVIALAGRASKIFITVRDPRDAVASLMQYHGHDFDQAFNLVEQTARLCIGFAQDRRARIFRYEDKFFENPDTVRAVAAELGYQLPQPVLRQIFDQLSRAEVEKVIAGLPGKSGVLKARSSGDFLDPQTHWHTHHAKRTGEIGRWRQTLSAAQATQIERRIPSL